MHCRYWIDTVKKCDTSEYTKAWYKCSVSYDIDEVTANNSISQNVIRTLKSYRQQFSAADSDFISGSCYWGPEKFGIDTSSGPVDPVLLLRLVLGSIVLRLGLVLVGLGLWICGTFWNTFFPGFDQRFGRRDYVIIGARFPEINFITNWADLDCFCFWQPWSFLNILWVYSPFNSARATASLIEGVGVWQPCKIVRNQNA